MVERVAVRLRSFDFTSPSAITPASKKGNVRYPWDEWFDGDPWKLTQGEDFYVSPSMIERIIRTRASKVRVKVSIRHLPAINGDAPAIVMQRTDITGPYEVKLHEARQKRAAKKAAAEREAAEIVARIRKKR
jgi:hypothetical protein